tara:strand:- start:37 stop:222 length:186 start_codon:yes stop_codon:yes gene_type:complete
MDHRGSTMSAPNLMKKLIAAGTKIHHENMSPRKKSKADPNTAGRTRLFSLFVNPGDINNTI